MPPTLRYMVAIPLMFVAAMAQDQDFVLRSDVRLVSIDVGVRDAAGKYVGGLKSANFAVYDDGMQQPIRHFASTDVPVTVGLIVDNSGSMRPKRGQIVTAGLLFAKASNPRDEFFVINFNDKVYSGLPAGLDFTDELKILRSALFLGTPSGRTALYDAVDVGLKHLKLGHREMRVLVVVSDGGDNASQITLPGLQRELEESQAVVYCIGLLDPEDRELNPHVLRKLSSIGGGSLFLPASLDDVAAVFEKISGDIRTRYSLGFTPSSSRHRTHSVRVVAHDANGRKLTVNSRTSYRAGV